MYKRQDRGRLFRIKGYTIAEGSRTSKGSNIVNLLQLAEGEKVTNMICQSKEADTEGGFVTMVTKQGLIKRTPLEQYANIRKSGLIGIALNEGDALAWTRLTSGHDMLIVATRNGQAIRFNEEDARPMGRSGHGVRAIRPVSYTHLFRQDFSKFSTSSPPPTTVTTTSSIR